MRKYNYPVAGHFSNRPMDSKVADDTNSKDTNSPDNQRVGIWHRLAPRPPLRLLALDCQADNATDKNECDVRNRVLQCNEVRRRPKQMSSSIEYQANEQRERKECDERIESQFTQLAARRATIC